MISAIESANTKERAVILCGLTIQGNIKGFAFIPEPLQLALESSAIRVLIHWSNMAQFEGLPEGVFARLDAVSCYGGGKNGFEDIGGLRVQRRKVSGELCLNESSRRPDCGSGSFSGFRLAFVDWHWYVLPKRIAPPTFGPVSGGMIDERQ